MEHFNKRQLSMLAKMVEYAISNYDFLAAYDTLDIQDYSEEVEEELNNIYRILEEESSR
jgi:hypothetical protein